MEGWGYPFLGIKWSRGMSGRLEFCGTCMHAFMAYICFIIYIIKFQLLVLDWRSNYYSCREIGRLGSTKPKAGSFGPWNINISIIRPFVGLQTYLAITLPSNISISHTSCLINLINLLHSCFCFLDMGTHTYISLKYTYSFNTIIYKQHSRCLYNI